jgi:hypothetical protein
VFEASLLAKYPQIGITSVLYDSTTGKYIASAHASPLPYPKTRLLTIIVESTDGINFTFVGELGDLPIGPNYDQGDSVDGHWLMKHSGVYILFGCTTNETTTRTWANWFAISLDLKHWYMYPTTVCAPTSTFYGRYRYPTVAYEKGIWYIVGLSCPFPYAANVAQLAIIEDSPPYSSTMLEEDSLAASASTALADCHALRGGRKLSLTVTSTYHASATAGVKVHVYTGTDAATYDTVEFTSFTVTLTAGTTVQKTVEVETHAKLVKVVVENLDGSYAATSITVTASFGD